MLRFKHSALAVLASAALALTACGSGGFVKGYNVGATGDSVTLNMVTMVQPNVPNAPVQNWFLDEIESRSNGRITVNRTEPDSICKPAEIAECVRDGRADIGISISDYTPQLFPTMSIATIPFMAENSQAFMQAIHRANVENEEAQAAWDRSGVHLIAAWSPGAAIMGANKEIDSVKDLKDMRFRVTGAYLQQAFETAGANVVALTASETYEGVERGIADAASWTMDGPVDYKLMEQLKNWSVPGTGVYTTFAMWMNQKSFDALPDDLKAVVEEVQLELINGEGMEAFNGATEEQCDTLYEFKGVESFTAWDEDDTAEWKDLTQDDLIAQWLVQAGSDGLENPEKFLDAYRNAYEEAASQPDIVEDPVMKCVERFKDR